MEITSGAVEDIAVDNDINLATPIFPVGLSIGTSSINLKNLTIAERPTQRPQLPSPNQAKVINAMNHPKEHATNQKVETPRKGNYELHKDSLLVKMVSPRDKNQKQISPREKTAKDSPRDTKTKQTTPRGIKINTSSQQKITANKKSACKEGRMSNTPIQNKNTSVPKNLEIFPDIQNENTSTLANSTKTTTTTTHLQNGNMTLDEKEYSWNFSTSLQFNVSERRTTKYESVKELKETRDEIVRHMKQIDDKLITMKEHKVVLANLSFQMKDSSRVAFELKRNNQGVPFVNAVKEFIKVIHESFHNNTNRKRRHQITTTEVPFIADINATFKTFGQVCERIILTTVNYSVMYLEDFHLITGKIHGMIECVIALYYTDITDDEDHSSYEQENNAEDKLHGSLVDSSCISVTNLSCYCESQKTTPQDGGKHAKGALKGLETLGNILAKSNECLGNISRLSLGNPKNQSLYDAFAVVANILKECEKLFDHFEEMKLPCVGMLKEALSRASKIADGSKPGEKQVEELKYSLGECDGKLFILAKHISN